MKTVLWLAVLFFVFIGCIQADKNEFSDQINPLIEKDEKMRNKKIVSFPLVRLLIVNIVPGRTRGPRITHYLPESLMNVSKS